jgi:hypothetical protein
MRIAWILLAVVGAVGIAAACTMNHNECDLSAFGSHCDNGVLVTCVDHAQGEPCVAKEGCDTSVTRTACANALCVTDGPSTAVCASTPDAGADGGTDGG